MLKLMIVVIPCIVCVIISKEDRTEAVERC